MTDLDSVRDFFLVQLDRGLQTPALIAMLKGSGWPAVGVGQRPYELFLDATEGYSVYRKALTRRLASALNEKWDEREIAPEAMYGLLNLCANIYDPEILADPLEKMVGRGSLHGDHRGIGLRGFLRSAVAFNQRDDRFLGVWEAMLQGSVDAWLPGTWEDGFAGILGMKPLQGTHPDFSVLGRALKQVQNRLGELEDGGNLRFYKNLRLRGFLDTVKRRYPNIADWDLLLVQMASDEHWDPWGFLSLRWIVHLTDSFAYVLNSVAEGLRAGFGLVPDKLLWGGIVRRVNVGGDSEALELLRKIENVESAARKTIAHEGLKERCETIRDTLAVYIDNGKCPKIGRFAEAAARVFKSSDAPMLASI